MGGLGFGEEVMIKGKKNVWKPPRRFIMKKGWKTLLHIKAKLSETEEKIEYLKKKT